MKGWIVDGEGAPLVYGDDAEGTKVRRLRGEGYDFVPDDTRPQAPQREAAAALAAQMAETDAQQEDAAPALGERLAELEAKVAAIEAGQEISKR